MTRKRITNHIVSLLGALAIALGLFAASAIAAGPGNVTITVTAVGKKDTVPPAVKTDDVQLYLNKERTQLAAFVLRVLGMVFIDSDRVAQALQ